MKVKWKGYAKSTFINKEYAWFGGIWMLIDLYYAKSKNTLLTDFQVSIV